MIDSGRTDHAVVLGGSMAGLLAARVLADVFARVTVVERDRYPQAPQSRRGVPQAAHLHVLLMRGLDILKDLFPGIDGDLVGHGAVAIDTGADLKWLTPGGWGPQFHSGLRKLAFSRELLDWLVQRHLAARSNVHWRDGWEARSLLSAGGCVTGVRIH